jgi:hypothetical protein
MRARNIARILHFVISVILAVVSVDSYAQNDACNTVDTGHSTKACQHPGAGCDVGTGPNTGLCVFVRADGVCQCEPRGHSGPTAVVGHALSAPVYVNLYWDADWDADNPSMPKDELDAFAAALLNSSYFAGLSEYGVGFPSFGGGFLPDSACRQKAPSRVGYYSLTGPSISDFLDCELNLHGLPHGPQVVYNIIMPAGSLESDFFETRTLCTGGPTAWHFHQTPYTAEAIAALGAALLNVSTGGTIGALADLLTALALIEEPGPIYTITSADPACGNLIKNLAHEMAEAASDPFPSSDVILSGSGETVDICDDQGAATSAPFVPSGNVLPAKQSFPSSGRFTTASTISVPQYWSNAGRKCITGFTDNTTPTGPGGGALQAAMSGNGADITFTITGSGFGLLPSSPPGRPPWSVNLPYIAIQNKTQGWQAGNSLNSDLVRLNVASWSDTGVAVNGFFFIIGNLVMQPGDHLSYWVCNPASGKCKSGNATLVEPGSPQLKVFVNNTNNVTLSYDVLVDGVKVAGPLFNDMSTGWVAFSGSPTVTVTENATQPGFFAPRFINGGCDASGRVSLKPGDNQTCRILNIATSGCAAGQHCCSGNNSAGGCIAGCVPDAVQCKPLCPQGKKCCAGPAPNGQCNDQCIGAKQSCE